MFDKSYIDLLNEDMKKEGLSAKIEGDAIGIYNSNGYLAYVADDERVAHAFLHGMQYKRNMQ